MQLREIPLPEEFFRVTKQEKVDFYRDETTAEIKMQLKAFGLPVSGSRSFISVRLYNRVFFNLDHWYRSVE